jgi:hypothetical protein
VNICATYKDFRHKSAGAAFHTIQADGVEVFYREAGPRDAPVILLLHGFPSSSHMYRDLIPLLATKSKSLRPSTCCLPKCRPELVRIYFAKKLSHENNFCINTTLVCKNKYE